MDRVVSSCRVAGSRRAFGLCAALLLLVSCTAGNNRPAGQSAEGPPSLDWPSLDWNTDVVGDTIVVSLTDPAGFYRVEQVTLVGPAGQRIDAEEISRRTYRESGSVAPRVSSGVRIGSGGRSGVGVGFNFPLITNRSGRTPVNEIEARIRLPDPAGYRREARRWRIVIAMTDANGNSSRAEIPAPTDG